MIFDYITKLFSKENENSVFSYTKPVDLEYFFIPLNKRGRYNHGLIACFNSISDTWVFAFCCNRQRFNIRNFF